MTFRSERAAGYLFVATMAAAALLSLATAVFGFLPFEPYRAYGYEVVPAEVCRGEEIGLYIDREVVDPLLGSVPSVDVESFWVKEGGPGRLSSGEVVTAASIVSLDIEPVPRETVVSPVLRSAPDSRGDWRAETTLTVNGRMGFLPRTQTIEIATDNTVVVDDFDRCGEEPASDTPRTTPGGAG